jgi:hypothetical protein
MDYLVGGRQEPMFTACSDFTHTGGLSLDHSMIGMTGPHRRAALDLEDDSCEYPYEEVMMAVRTELCPVATPTDVSALDMLMAEPESVISDAPLYTPSAAGVLLLLILLSPKGPKENK